MDIKEENLMKQTDSKHVYIGDLTIKQQGMVADLIEILQETNIDRRNDIKELGYIRMDQEGDN